MRGNPWSDLGSQYPPPPKAPTARRPAQQQQPSAGAERYKKWEAPKQTAYQAAHEGAGARQKTYEAWESMKNTKPQPSSQTSQAGSSKTTRPPVPPRETPQPQGYREPTYSNFDVPPPKKKDDGRKKTGDEPGFFEAQRARQAAAASRAAFQQEPRPESRSDSPPKRTHSTRAFDSKRFAPSTPGGDEPAASKGAYFTQRDKPAVAPDLPARDLPIPTFKRRSREGPLMQDLSDEDRQKYFGTPKAEPRISTPYSTQGGEKLNPRDASINRSKSTRESSQRFTEDGQIPRPESDSNMHRSHSSATRGHTSNHRKVPSVEIETDSSEDYSQAKRGSFGTSRRTANGAFATNASSQVPPSPLKPQHERKRNSLTDFRGWLKDNKDVHHPLNSFPAEGPPLRSETKATAEPESKAEPSMYAQTNSLKSNLKRSATYSSRLPKVSDDVSPLKKQSTSNPFVIATSKYPNLFPDDPKSVASSGTTDDRGSLTAFEGMQRSMIDQLLHTKQNGPSPNSATPQTSVRDNQKQGPKGAPTLSGSNFTKFRESSETTSSLRSRRTSQFHSSHSYGSSQARCFWTELEKLKASTNVSGRDRFSFNVNDETFKSPAYHPAAAGFSSSSENISTKFSEKDWTGKFEGTEYFKPVPNAPSRTQSGSRVRGRSPTKPTIDPRFPQPSGSESEQPAESPGGTKFSAQEWADTFRPQTFAPPPPRPGPSRKRTGPMVRPTMGNAAVVDGDTSDEKPLSNGRKTPLTPTMPSPDAMDVDMPPVSNTVPQFQAPPIRVETTTSPKRAAAPSPSPTDEAALKVNFDDLKIQDLLSTLEMPRPPQPPALPENLPNTRPSEVAYEDYQIRFAKYMTAWDLYNNQFLLHLVARKNQNDALGMKRWLSDEGIEVYRRGLKEDGMVLSRWAAEKEKHESVVREWIVLKEQIKEGAAREPARARKKTH